MSDVLTARFDGRILSTDIAIANIGGKQLADREAAGWPMLVVDGVISATAKSHGLALVTGDAADFAGATGEIVDPPG